MLAAGLFAGILRDLYELAVASLKRSLCKGTEKGKREKIVSVLLDWIGEILFFVLLGIIAFSFLYYCCYGELSFHAFFTFVLGVFLWKKLFCGIIL